MLNRTDSQSGNTGHGCFHSCVLVLAPGLGGKEAEMRSSQALAKVSGEAAPLGRRGHMRASGLPEPRSGLQNPGRTSQEDTARAPHLLACLEVSGRHMLCLRSGFGKAGI